MAKFRCRKNTVLDLDQSHGGSNVNSWVTINEVSNTVSPSQVLGTIQSPGQVYVIDQNGIIFGGSSQVNVGALTASSLALNPSYIANGLLNNSGNDYQFQFSSLVTTSTQDVSVNGHNVAETVVQPLWSEPLLDARGNMPTVSSVPAGNVTVQAGAQLNSLTNAEGQGGRIALVGPNVTNDGTISTPEGQTILAAGLQVEFTAHDSDDASLRGLDVFVGQVNGVSSSLPSGSSFVFDGLPYGESVSFSGTGQVGSYTAAGSTTAEPIAGGTLVNIPAGSTVTLSGGSLNFNLFSGGTASNGESNALDSQGNATLGDIEAPQGSATIIGRTVNQFGIIDSSTSVTLNGRIDLLADYNSVPATVGSTTMLYPLASGSVTLGEDSVTQILPDLSSSATTIGTELPFVSLVNIQGLNFEMDPGSLLYAPGASTPSSSSSPALNFLNEALSSGVTIDAGTWYQIGTQPGEESSSFSNGAGQISLDSGAVIDVSGSEDVSSSVAEDIVAVQLRGPELADSPLQRAGALRGETVYIDIRNIGVYDGTSWIGTPLGDVSGYADDVLRTAGELTTNGGSVSLTAGTSVTTAPGAVINVSGGWINYSGATVNTTNVVLDDGQVVNISQATPDQVYGGLSTGDSTTSAKWGVTQNFINELESGTQYDAGFLQGGSGGAVSITSPSMSLGGSLDGNTVEGTYQRTPQSTLSSTYSSAAFLPLAQAVLGAPDASQLDLNFYQATVDNISKVYSESSPNVEFQTDAYISQHSPMAGQVLLSQDIANTDGFGNLAIDTNASGSIIVPAGVSLETSPGGQISFYAANIDIDGSVAAPGGGTLNFSANDVAPTSNVQFSTPAADPDRGQFVLGPNASLSASGLLVDDLPNSPAPDSLPLATSGGDITISALDVDLSPGSTIDVSGGAAVSSAGAISYGAGGKINILAGKDPQVASLVTSSAQSGSEFVPGLILGSTLTGYSGAMGGGGSLTIQSPLVQIGGANLENGDSSTAGFTSGEAGVSSNGVTLWLDGPGASPGEFFNEGGFSNYTIEGIGQIESQGGGYVFDGEGNPVISPAILIASGESIHPVVQMEVAQADNGQLALTILTPEQSAQLLPSQRSAGNLVLDAEGVVSGFSQDSPPLENGGSFSNGAGGGGVLVRGDLIMQDGASIETDPQTNASNGISLLAGNGMIAVLGTVISPGGTINVTGGNTASPSDNQLLFYNASPDQPFPTVDLGPSSVLSAVGVFEQTANVDGLTTGSVLPGGSITVQGNIVAEWGAVLDVSGASVYIDEPASATGESGGGLQEQLSTGDLVSSNGGAITLKGKQLLYTDATLRGSAGGSSSEGGSLTISSSYAQTSNPDVPAPGTPSVTLVISQLGLNSGYSIPIGSASGLALLDGQTLPSSPGDPGLSANGANGGEPVYSYFAANPNLFVATATDHSVTDNGGQAGGFASLTMPGTLDFVGNVNITTSSSINLAMSSGNPQTGETGGVIYADSTVQLTAPYVALNSYATSILPDQLTYPSAASGAGTLVVNASVLADIGNLSLQNIGTLVVNSDSQVGGDVRGDGTLQVDGQINLNAAQVYPPTEVTFTIEANDISITSPTNEPLPSLPLSAGGTLDLDAATISQSGVLRAPFGVINLGNGSTQEITLAEGSITSVSGVDPTTGEGITVPYGIVSESGIWYDPQGNDISLTGPPVKQVNITGASVQIQTGSTIDLTGGGTLFAYQFTAGTGGTEDILASTGGNFSSTSFAIIPGYTLDYAPDGTYNTQTSNLQTNGITDVGYYNSNLKVGEQIYLNGGNGLPAGTYTLLPARYALLPGAYLVTPNGSSTPNGQDVELPEYTVMNGYTGNSLASTSAGLFSSFQIYSQAAVLNRAPYSIEDADTFFPASAAASNVAVPLLPVDAGQLVLDATQAMTLEGTLLAQPGAGGLGGQVDIASSEPIDIVGPNSAGNAPSGALVLDSSQLTELGASSLLIGGYRTTTQDGTDITVTTNDLVVDNSGSTATVDGQTVNGLAAPDLILVSGGTLTIADQAEVEQLGSLMTPAPTLLLQGNGDLLRVSSDTTAQIVRQNVVAGDTSSVLTIGSGAQIQNASGGAVGSLILDSSGVVQIDHSATPAVLLSTSLTVDSSLINIELSTPATGPTSGLVITSAQLNSLLQSVQSLSLLSYSSIALYGAGTIGAVTQEGSSAPSYQLAQLALHATDIYYADTVNSSGITINAQTVSLDNLPDGTTLPSLSGLGTSDLSVNAETITLGSNALALSDFANVSLSASSAILLKGLGAQTSTSDAAPIAASFSTSGNLLLSTPDITAAASPDQTPGNSTTVFLDESISAGGSVILQSPAGDTVALPSTISLGSMLTISGSSITQQSGEIVLHSGSLSLDATGTGTGASVVIDGTLDVSGVSPTFYDLTKYTNGGEIELASSNGSVNVGRTGSIDLAAASGTGSVDSGAGNGGSLTVSAAGLFTPGTIEAQGSTVTQQGEVVATGTGGTLILNVGSLDSTGNGNGLLSTIETGLTGFATQSVADQNDATVTVDDTISAGAFNLYANKGSIVVTGTVNAAGTIGGDINLAAAESVSLQANSELTVAASQLNDAGQGGAITLTAGVYEGTAPSSSTAAIDLEAGSTVDLGVNGTNGGSLVLNAPQVSGNAYVTGASYVAATTSGNPVDLAIAPIASGIINNAGSIVLEGTYVQDAAQQGSAFVDSYEGSAESNASAFMAQASTIQSRIFGGTAPSGMQIEPGEEIDNCLGSLELLSTWDLSTFRYNGVAGILTLRAAGNVNIDFGASLTDGFETGLTLDSSTLLPVGSQSWSYQITAGADFNSANLGAVQSMSSLQASGLGGSLQVGYQNSFPPTGLSTSSDNDIDTYFQTIRTGSGSISINAGDDVLLLNNLATIYTAGSQVDPTDGGLFTQPSGQSGGVSIPATYSSGGGNVTITAQGDIAHEAYNSLGTGFVSDSSPEMPTNWLFREGSSSLPTTWWVDYSNFLEGVGALGGGNVTMTAGGSVINVDAVAPTNAREINGQLLELGGGDVTVTAGNNIDGGVYYVERGQGTLTAGNNILTNSTRAAVTLTQSSTSADWLPTTLFLGDGNFDVTAQGDLLLGPIANPFLLPQSYNNTSIDKTTSEISYFSTYAASDAVNVTSLAGTVTIRDFADDGGQGSLYAWYANVMDSPISRAPLGSKIAAAEPWLDLALAATGTVQIRDFEDTTSSLLGAPTNDFGGVTALAPPTLRISALTGDIDIVGSITLDPSYAGTLNLVAAGSINGFEVNSQVILGVETSLSGSSLINLSDANPDLVPTYSDPFTTTAELLNLDAVFSPSAVTEGLTLQQRELFTSDIHDASLSADDFTLYPAYNSDPAYIYAATGDISGLTLYSSKETQVIAGQDITDIGLYLQNNNASDISLVQAGEDIIAYDAASPLRLAAGSNIIGYDSEYSPLGGGTGAPNPGDIQISGPGTLEVLAGGNLTLGDDNGQNSNNANPGDGLFSGITSVGNEVNPTLPFAGADIVAAAGLGSGLGLTGANLDFTNASGTGFIDQFLNPDSAESSVYLPDLGTLLDVPGSETDLQIWNTFEALNSAAQDALALKVFYLVLRDAGRDHNDTSSPNFGVYTEGYAAIAALFPSSQTYSGDIDVTSREIKTSNGGDINLLTPGGGVTVGIDAGGSQAVDQGILTVDGGNINIFANNDVSLGTSRIFTLAGGNEIIWSTVGDIDAGASSKTVVSAPPTRVIVDPTSGAVETDLAGLATGGGIGVLEAFPGAPPSDVDLIAPVGTVDAGDAGIRASGSINIAAAKVLNSSNISAGGSTTGVPASASVNIGAVASASSAAGSSTAAAQNGAPPQQGQTNPMQDLPSIIDVEVLGYGGIADD